MGDKRGDFPGGKTESQRHSPGNESHSQTNSSPRNQNQEEEGGRSIIRNNQEHKTISIYKVIAFIAAVPLGAAFIFGFRVSRYTDQEITDVVRREVPTVPYSRDKTIVEKIRDHDEKFNFNDYQYKQMVDDLQKLEVRVHNAEFALEDLKKQEKKRYR